MPTRTSLLAAAFATAASLSACATTSTDTAAPALPSSRPNPVVGGPGPAGATEAVVAAADAFLATLSTEQRSQTLYDVTDPALRRWTYFPSSGDRNGLPFGDLSDEQRAAALGVAEAVLSNDGYAQLRGVIAAEDALRERNGSDDSVSSDRYFIALFGQPSVTDRFTVQINGHHLAVNTTYENSRVSPTPAFTGVDPVAFEVAGKRVEPMRDEADAVSDLLGSLNDDDRTAARIDGVDDVLVGPANNGEFPPQSEGVLLSELRPEQRDRVTTAVRAWVGDTDERVAEVLMDQYQAEYDRTRVAWAGSTDPDVKGAYLRIDGPRLWIEFSNVGRFDNGDLHYHSIYRDKQFDYGA
ncbi:DUF3500 domain-containing protein [Phytohabitans kaempferiae]|uniref:DUF3500 domain-containing protein n=1 Tax=Phytohabitans kaempferiae TaxID=1620943 RepID=A0ABV6MC90_9ACTN